MLFPIAPAKKKRVRRSLSWKKYREARNSKFMHLRKRATRYDFGHVRAYTNNGQIQCPPLRKCARKRAKDTRRKAKKEKRTRSKESLQDRLLRLPSTS